MSKQIVIPKTAAEYQAWFQSTDLSPEAKQQAAKVGVSFNTLAMKNHPDARDSLQRLHDADMAKLEAMVNGNSQSSG